MLELHTCAKLVMFTSYLKACGNVFRHYGNSDVYSDLHRVLCHYILVVISKIVYVQDDHQKLKIIRTGPVARVQKTPG